MILASSKLPQWLSTHIVVIRTSYNFCFVKFDGPACHLWSATSVLLLILLKNLYIPNSEALLSNLAGPKSPSSPCIISVYVKPSTIFQVGEYFLEHTCKSKPASTKHPKQSPRQVLNKTPPHHINSVESGMNTPNHIPDDDYYAFTAANNSESPSTVQVLNEISPLI